jgi:hypothetical protein
MKDTGFIDGDLVFLRTPGTHDLLALNLERSGGYPGGCALEVEREHGLAGVQGGASHFGIMLESCADYDTAIATAPEYGGRLVSLGVYTDTFVKTEAGWHSPTRSPPMILLPCGW